MIKNTPVNAEDLGSIPGPVRSSEGGNGNPLQYFCLGHKEPGRLQSLGLQESQTGLSN